ncbi:hypothetical protein ABZ208_24395 [Streptomyces sp. NPDC006208]|uniref:hypothetical protein n=1 Tax=Streptomyces sp. NPDC006208 TaxID=3156734 RepID=UPI0033A780CB
MRDSGLSGVLDRLRRSLARTLALTALPAVLVGAPAASAAFLSSDGIHPFVAAGTGAPRDRSPAPLGSRPWVLRAERLVLHGSVFHGVVTVRTAAGAERVLKFTARLMDIAGLDLTTGGSSGLRLRARPAATSTIRGKGVVTLYTARLSGSLTSLGGAPLPAVRSVTISPDALPGWLSHPGVATRTVAFDDVSMSQIGQFGGDLTIAGPDFRAAGR